MKILIYGGSGIISSEITSFAIDLGNDVTIVNRGKRKGFIHHSANLIVADLKNDSLDVLREKINDNYDVVIDVVSYTSNELKKNMMIVSGKCKQYVFFSTAVVYSTKNGRYTEEDEAGNTEWMYAINKIKCEQYLMEHSNECGFAYTIIRPYITYGKTRIPLQFGPLEYYTIINRAKHGKPIPVYYKETKCTLTYSKDFAKGIVGLLGNPNAYNQKYHITGSYETTWNSVLETTMKYFETEYTTVPLTDDQLRNKELMKGLDASEVYGDKGRDMLFDNSKIRKAAPDFVGKTQYEKVLPEIVDYFRDVNNQRINYAWDARVDNMLSKVGLTREQKKTLAFAEGRNSTSHDRLVYFMNRYDFTYFIGRIIRKISKKNRI